nr:hypothetical protein [Tanacetum cinerariifolium]
MRKAVQERPQCALPSNTIPSPREEIKAITTQSGNVLAKPSVPLSPPTSPSKEVERDMEMITNQVLTENTTSVPPPVFQPFPFSRPSEIPTSPTSRSFVILERNLHQPLIPYPSRPFSRTAGALVDVYGEELILRDDDEKLIFHADSISKYPHKHGNESINMINFIDITCKDHFNEALKIQKSFHPFSGSTTTPSDSFPCLTSSETSDSSLEEFVDELTLFNPFPLGNKDDNFDPKAYLREIKYLLNRDPSTDSSPKTDIDIIDPILERFTDEPALVYSFPLDDEDDDLFDLENDNDEWRNILYHDPFDDIHSEKDKIKDSKMKILIDELESPKSNVLLP